MCKPQVSCPPLVARPTTGAPRPIAKANSVKVCRRVSSAQWRTGGALLAWKTIERIAVLLPLLRLTPGAEILAEVRKPFATVLD